MDGAVALEGRPLTTSTHKPGSGPRFQSVTPVRTSRRCAPRPVDAVEAARGCLHFRAFVRTSLFSPSFPLTSPPPEQFCHQQPLIKSTAIILSPPLQLGSNLILIVISINGKWIRLNSSIQSHRLGSDAGKRAQRSSSISWTWCRLQSS